MIHGLNNSFLYAAKKIIVTIRKDDKDILFMGTGFFIDKDNKLILVTNRHVIEPWYADKKYCGFDLVKFEIESYQSNDSEGKPCNFKKANITNFKDFKFSSNKDDDVACLIGPRGDDLTVNSTIPYNFLADDIWINTKLSVCDNIAYPGFPKFFDKINNAPIFRMGTIASDPRFDYSGFEDMTHSARIAYEGFSSGGASGSPIFATQNGYRLGSGLTDTGNSFYREAKLIGINAGHYDEPKLIVLNENPKISFTSTEHSGISFFYKSTIIKKIIEE